MDEKRSELVSRALDDDLSGAERAEFERRLVDDDELAAEFASMRELRRAVARMADEMEPPAALDAVMKPLRLSPPTTTRRVRPAFRWLGAAAAVVLGVTVTLEVARRNPAPSPRPEPRPRIINHDDREIFELAPLPSAVPNNNRPLGATDHLLEEEPAHPPAPEPQAVEIIGPLTDEEHAEIADPAPASSRAGVTEKSVPSLGGVEKRAEKKGVEKRRVPASEAAGITREKDGSPSPGRTRGDTVSGKAQTASPGYESRDSDGAFDRAGTIPAVVTMGGVEIWGGWSSNCTESRWDVVLGVQDGVVVTIEPPAGHPKTPAEEECLLLDFVGTVLDGVSDGRHVAEGVLR